LCRTFGFFPKRVPCIPPPCPVPLLAGKCSSKSLAGPLAPCPDLSDPLKSDVRTFASPQLSSLPFFLSLSRSPFWDTVGDLVPGSLRFRVFSRTCLSQVPPPFLPSLPLHPGIPMSLSFRTFPFSLLMLRALARPPPLRVFFPPPPTPHLLLSILLF